MSSLAISQPITPSGGSSLASSREKLMQLQQDISRGMIDPSDPSFASRGFEPVDRSSIGYGPAYEMALDKMRKSIGFRQTDERGRRRMEKNFAAGRPLGSTGIGETT